MPDTFTMELGHRTLTLEFGELAKQANGSVLVRYGDTVVLVTATMAKQPRPDIDFFPLIVDYEEKMYSVGKIPGGWGRREGRPGEEAILAARMIDRPLRPLFPEGFRNDVQVVAAVLSVDQNNSPSIAAMIGASAALTVSDIPFEGPIGGVKVGRVDGKFVINPTSAEEAKSDLDLVVAGTADAIMMVEAGANEVDEEIMLQAIMFGHEEVKKICALQEEIRAKIGKPKVEVELFQPEETLVQWITDFASDKLKEALYNQNKLEREQDVSDVRTLIHETYQQQFGEEKHLENEKAIDAIIDDLTKTIVRTMIINGIRPDGRKTDQIRPISVKVGILPRTHGSGLFTRGQTQVLTVCTLGLKSDEQLLDNLTDEDRKRYIHHYNFPPFSVGEVRSIRSPGRREIGHGALAERALLPMIPSEEEFPYTIRLVSEVLESNGSSSQASVCGSTLALMDAGVPIKRPVAGIAMGLVKYEDQIAILTDIQGLEDALGDMDFKVAGTSQGITALQMDIKVSGVSEDILRNALAQAREGRLFILDKMLEVIAQPREELSPYAPRIITTEIPVDRIRDVIGPGGKTIRKIIEETNVAIDIDDDGRVYIASTADGDGEKALRMIESYTKDVEVGASYLGVVKRIMKFGAFVEILPGKEGLVHISQLANERVNRVEDVLNVGDEVLVKVTDIDRQGRINLSRKAVLTNVE
ncbi:MAG: polyribonucleotide nucleotidyltransferase [Firmicutes bacterium]|nr:polyribonucleotide nucleotidyltransferase [Bacillota bacterium]